MHKQMNVVALAIHFHEFSLEVTAYLREQGFQSFNGLTVEHGLSVFSEKDQMHMHVENAVTALPNVLDFCHRPNYIKIMQRIQAYQFRLKPDDTCQLHMRGYVGSCRFVFNKALALQIDRREKGLKHLSYVKLCAELKTWKSTEETAWLNETPSQALQQSLKNLDTAYKRFFQNLSDFPRFKKKGLRDSYRYPQGVKLDQDNSRIFLPKLGWMRFHNSRKVEGDICNATVSFKAGHWYVSIQTEREVDQPRHPSVLAAGVDMGIVRFATLWDGGQETVIEPLNSFKRHQVRLAKAQRQMSRKVKFSANWKKAKARVQTIHHQIANARNDFLHKTSHSLSQNHALLCVEDLQVSNMSRSAKGTTDAPGKNVSAKAGLNRSILDQGWGEFRRQLDYKQQWMGGWVVAVAPAYTSQTCPICSHVHRGNRLSQSKFQCQSCGHAEHADTVAGKNIRERGLKLLEGPDLAQIACEVNGAVMPSAAGTTLVSEAAFAV